MSTETEDPGMFRSWQPFVKGGASVCGGDGYDGDIEGKIII